MDSRGTVGSTYKGEYYTLVHIKYKALGHMVSEKKIFLCLSNCKSKGAIDPQGWGHF